MKAYQLVLPGFGRYVVSELTRQKLSAAGKKRAESFTSDYQRNARAKLAEKHADNPAYFAECGSMGYWTVGEKYGFEVAVTPATHPVTSF